MIGMALYGLLSKEEEEEKTFDWGLLSFIEKAKAWVGKKERKIKKGYLDDTKYHLNSTKTKNGCLTLITNNNHQVKEIVIK